MIASHLPRTLQGEPFFRWRGGSVSRVESLSDMVFAFALTLIVVSLEVPGSSRDLMAIFVQFPVFAVCFALLVYCWYHNYLFHRRFGLESLFPTFLSTTLLFVILFYVYPLKYVFTALYMRLPVVRELAGRPGAPRLDLGGRPLMIFFSAGFTGIFLLYAIMNLYAYRRRGDLDLNAAERVITRGSIRGHLLSAAIGILSILLSLFEPLLPAAGLIYFLMAPVHGLNGYFTGKRAGEQQRVGS